MRVGIEKRYIGSYKSVVKDANKLLRKSSKVSKKKYEKALLNKELSVEKKKQQLVKALHQLILHAFSVKQSNKKKALKSVRDHAELIRLVIHKIKDINNYLEESLLKELGIVKKSIVMKAVKAKNPERFLEKQRGLPKSYIKKIEHTVYKLMQEIVFFDERLIRGYGKKEIRIIGKEKVEIKGIEKLLKTETEILDALEWKIPPA